MTERTHGQILGEGLDAIALELDELRRAIVATDARAAERDARILGVLERVEAKLDALAVRMGAAEGQIRGLEMVRGGRGDG